MRPGLTIAAILPTLFTVACNSARHSANKVTSDTPTSQVVEAGCATCIFDMKDVTGCKLAVEIDGKAYLVTGSGIDDHGNAHAADGLCNTRRIAEVKGKIDGDRFDVREMTLLPKQQYRRRDCGG